MSGYVFTPDGGFEQLPECPLEAHESLWKDDGDWTSMYCEKCGDIVLMNRKLVARMVGWSSAEDLVGSGE